MSFELFCPPPPPGLKPNLAAKMVPEKHKLPCFASPKLDGIRALGVPGQLLSRTLKPIPNAFVQSLFSNLNGLDGELIVGAPNHPNVMQITSSGVMKRTGKPDVTFYVFDRWDLPKEDFAQRFQRIEARIAGFARVKMLEQVWIRTAEELDAYEAKCLAEGYEGIITRDPNRKYKFGRSTANEGGMIKVKRFSHGEARIIDFEELMHNENEAYIGELGQTKRSSHQENLVASGRLGALWVSTPEFEEPFKISACTMTHNQQQWAWENQGQLLNEICRFRWFKHGTLNVPRHGQWAGFRHMMDLGVEHPLYNEKFADLPVTMEFPSE